MKRIIILLFVSAMLSSCSLDDGDQAQYTFESVPIVNVNAPEEFEFGETYRIAVSYMKPTNCHRFNNFFYESDGNQRTIAVINSVFDGTGCLELENELEEVSFNFTVTSHDTYVFRFWEGLDDNDNDIYYIIEIPVIN